MSIPPDLEARILRYYHVEKWRINTIARQLHVHHSTVQRVLAQAGLPTIGMPRRACAIDPYVPFVTQTLERFPTLTASRLFMMVRERGYQGSASQFRRRVALLRPRRPTEAYLRLRTLPGEQGQIDWAHFGHLVIGRARRPLMAFVMVLSYSRQIYLRFFLDARMPSFLAGHVGAFAAMGGVPRVLLYDNLKSAVLERQMDAIRFHPTLLAFAAHHRFEPRPVAPARGNQKECGAYCLLWVMWNNRLSWQPCEVGRSRASRAYAGRRADTGNGGRRRSRAEAGQGLPSDGPWRRTLPTALPPRWQ
jgi:transposase